MNTDEFRTRPRGVFFAIALILAGTLLFLDNLGLLPIDNIGAYWPLALVVYGLGRIYRKQTRSNAVWSITVILAGILLVLGNLHILRVTVEGLWPLFIIALGVVILFERSRWSHLDWLQFKGRARLRSRRRHFAGASWAHPDFMRSHFSGSVYAEGSTARTVGGHRLSEEAVFFPLKRRLEDPDFQGGEIVAVFGSIELDLSDAGIKTDAPGAILDASVVFGSIDIRVPRTWRIIQEADGVFGSYEDKTIPARAELGIEPPRLIIRGGAVFGSVTIHN